MNTPRSVLISIFISAALLALSTSSIKVGSAAPANKTPSPNSDSDECCINESSAIIPPGKSAPRNDQQRVELKIATAPDDYSASKLEDEPLLPNSSVTMVLDDGHAENNIGVGTTNAYQFIWLNRFTPDPAEFPFYLNKVEVLYSGSGLMVGDAIDLVVYEDKDGEPPGNATWLATYHNSIQAINGSTWSEYTLNPPVYFNGPGDVLVGLINRFVDSGFSSPSFPAALDESSTQRRSWVGKWDADPPVPPILPPDSPPDGYFDLIDAFDFPGNWMIRGYGETLISAPNLITPTNGVNINDNTPQFDWSSVLGATLYKLQIDNDENFSNPEVDITTSNTSNILTSALADDKYYWRVQARDESGIWGLWSSPTWTFTINQIPSLITPSNGANINDNTPQFNWSFITGAALYKLQIDNDVNFSNPEVDITTSNTSYTLTSALVDDKYYWRVQANDQLGIWGPWSYPTWTFTIDTINYLFLPISTKEYIGYFEGPDEIEPNNDWQHANGPLRAGKSYYGFPDEKDYFSFLMTDPGSITIDLTNHTGQGAQMQLFHQDVNHRVEDPIPVTKTPIHKVFNNRSSGLYYIYIYSNSGHNQEHKYTLEVDFP